MNRHDVLFWISIGWSATLFFGRFHEVPLATSDGA